MALVLPSLAHFKPATAGEQAEYEVIRQLDEALPESFTVFHHLDWHTVHGGRDTVGELDVVVLPPSGHVLSLEIKAGEVIEGEHSLTKRYQGQEKDILGQLRRENAALIASLRSAGLRNEVRHFLVLPHHHWQGKGTLNFPRERIIDADEIAGFPRQLLQSESTPLASDAERDRLHDHLTNRFRLIPDIDATDAAEAAVTRSLADGLATWVPRMESPSNTFVVEATAGSGKTQLALALLAEAEASGQRSLYLCFNRLLAKHVRSLAPTSAEVETFHGFCRRDCEARGEAIIPGTPSAFDALAAGFLKHADAKSGHYDLVIVDEGQDFSPEWVEGLLGLGKRFYLLRDENQALYGREAFEIGEATRIRCNDNFRSPRAFVELINLLNLNGSGVVARSPIAGLAPEINEYDGASDAALCQATDAAVRRCLDLGYRPEQIAVLSFAGVKHSATLKRETIANLSADAPSGRFSADGDEIRLGGELVSDTVFRFKGRSATAVVLTEVDFEQLNDQEKRKLFVGITRARRHLELVLSTRAAAALAQALN